MFGRIYQLEALARLERGRKRFASDDGALLAGSAAAGAENLIQAGVWGDLSWLQGLAHRESPLTEARDVGAR